MEEKKEGEKEREINAQPINIFEALNYRSMWPVALTASSHDQSVTYIMSSTIYFVFFTMFK